MTSVPSTVVAKLPRRPIRQIEIGAPGEGLAGIGELIESGRFSIPLVGRH